MNVMPLLSHSKLDRDRFEPRVAGATAIAYQQLYLDQTRLSELAVRRHDTSCVVKRAGTVRPDFVILVVGRVIRIHSKGAVFL